MSTSGGTTGGGTPLAVVQHRGGADAVTYTTPNAAATVVDGVNLIAPFTAPISGNVVVTLAAFADNLGAFNGFFDLMEGGAVVNASDGVACTQLYDEGIAGAGNVVVATFKVTGLGAGSAHTYQFGYHTAAGGHARIFTGPTFGLATMIVTAD